MLSKQLKMGSINKNIDKTSGFKLPENYFEDFRKQLRIDIEKDTPKKKTFHLSPIHYTIAASILLVIVSTFTFLPFNQNQNSLESSDVLLSDIEYYDIDMNDIYYAYNDELILENETETEINEDVLIEYLTEEIDINDMILYEE
jgi:hypothetical protein